MFGVSYGFEGSVSYPSLGLGFDSRVRQDLFIG